MSRWKPDGGGRLEQAAYELFLERGYEQTTVAEIAARAGLTERTFFRHYSDKREVLFGGSSALKDELLRVLGEVPAAVSAIAAVRIAIVAMSTLMNGRRELARERQRLVVAHGELQERELIKRATLTNALSAGLQQRGVPEPSAILAAEMGLASFHVGFTHWLDDTTDREFADIVDAEFDRLKAVLLNGS